MLAISSQDGNWNGIVAAAAQRHLFSPLQAAAQWHFEILEIILPDLKITSSWYEKLINHAIYSWWY